MSAPGTALPGTVVPASSGVSPGGAQGIQGIQGPNKVSTDAGNQATLGSDNLVYVPDPTPVITSVRLRSFNAVGNPNFEVQQRNPGAAFALGAGTVGGYALDRWSVSKSAATGTLNSGQSGTSITVLPGSTFPLSGNNLYVTVSTTQTTLAAGEYVLVTQNVEGTQLRELINDVHSLQLLAFCTNAISFSVSLKTVSGTDYSYVSSLLNLPANVWTLFTIPNIPIWSASGTWPITAGNVGYLIRVCLGAGSTFQAPSTGSWIAGNYYAPAGVTNLLSLSGAIFRLGFIQHEPGPQCTTLIDKPFIQNLDECCRYFQKSYPYSSAPGANTGWVCPFAVVPTTPAGLQSTLSYFPFPHRMAKAPTLTSYATNGTINSATMYTQGTVLAVSSVGGNDGGLTSLNFATVQTAGQAFGFHYTADTGW
jgi:hypothetical protein